VTALRHPAGRLPALLLLLAGVAAGCGTSPTAPSPSASAPAIEPSGSTSAGSPGAGSTPTSAAPSLTPVPGAPSGTPPAAPTPIGTTVVAGFGPILDAVPPSFPRLAGQEPADPGTEPMSGVFAVTLDAETAVAAIRTGLEKRGWVVDVGSPLEDGTVVLDARGPTPSCKAEVRFTPRGATLVVAVLYAATCPTS
jgi:hypothetical protein